MATGERKKSIKRGEARNEDIVFPPSLLKFLDERSAAMQAVMRQPSLQERLAEPEKDAKKRAEIRRRIYKKLGIVAEMEELMALDNKRRHPSG